MCPLDDQTLDADLNLDVHLSPVALSHLESLTAFNQRFGNLTLRVGEENTNK